MANVEWTGAGVLWNSADRPKAQIPTLGLTVTGGKLVLDRVKGRRPRTFHPALRPNIDDEVETVNVNRISIVRQWRVNLASGSPIAIGVLVVLAATTRFFTGRWRTKVKMGARVYGRRVFRAV